MTEKHIDPICGMTVAPETAAGKSEYQGETYYFCAVSCKQRFDADPARYLSGQPAKANAPVMVQLAPLKLARPAPAAPVVTLERASPSNPASERLELPITGMSCAACAHHIEQSLSATPGVRRAAVNFATARATVDFEPTVTGERQLRQAVKDAGYDTVTSEDSEADAHDVEYKDLRRKFWVAALLSLPVLVIAMSHGGIAALDFKGVEWLQLALTTPVVFNSGWQFYRGAWSAFRHRFADMNTLIAVGTGAAYLYSVAATIAPGFFATAKGHTGMT